MARYSLFVLKVPLNPKQTNKQTNFMAQFAPQTSGDLRSIAFSRGTLRWISRAHAVWRASTRMSVIYSMRRVDQMKVPRENAEDRRSPVAWVRTCTYQVCKR